MRRCSDAVEPRGRARARSWSAALDEGNVRWLPGVSKASCRCGSTGTANETPTESSTTTGGASIVASGYPRDIPNVPRERNLKGISFAVANASGFVARALEACAGRGDRLRRFSPLLNELDFSGNTRAARWTPARDARR